MMRFYRGIAVPAEAAAKVIADIRHRGLVPDQGHWRMNFNDLKPRLTELWQRSAVTMADTKVDGDKPSWACACADKLGATYYATQKNLTKTDDAPILISFDADLRDVIIDGRDILYTLFQFGDPRRARPIAEKIYGPKILQYVDRAWATEDQGQRIALCDLATQDDTVINAHAKNIEVIGGRHNTRFRTAFMVQIPVSAERIVGADLIDTNAIIPDAEITLDMIRARD
jgi:hypothetical protein